MGRGQKNFEKCSRRSLECPEQTGCRIVCLMNLLVRTQNEVKYGKENMHHFTQYLNGHQRQLVEIGMLKCAAGKSSHGNKEDLVEKWRKRDPCYLVLHSGRMLGQIVLCSYMESKTCK